MCAATLSPAANTTPATDTGSVRRRIASIQHPRAECLAMFVSLMVPYSKLAAMASAMACIWPAGICSLFLKSMSPSLFRGIRCMWA